MKLIISLLFIAGLSLVYYAFQLKDFTSRPPSSWKKVAIHSAPFQVMLPAQGAVEPRRRYIITPPVNGRIERILVNEGDHVKKGQVLAWMSSPDRAQLLDAAKRQGPKQLRHWSHRYRPTPIKARHSGQVNFKHTFNGQTVTTTTPLFELSDRLVIRTLIDDTNIRQIQLRQTARIHIESLPDLNINAFVSRISYPTDPSDEEKNFLVELQPYRLPKVVRTGMRAQIDLIVINKKRAKLIPKWLARGQENSPVEVMVKDLSGELRREEIYVGRSNGKMVELLSDLAEGTTLLHRFGGQKEQKAGALGL